MEREVVKTLRWGNGVTSDRVFLQLYKDRNVTVASQNLYISQQGMSKSIANLEKEIGFPLFKRSVSGVEPTVEAQELHIYFRTVMESYTALWKKVRELKRKEEGTLSIVWPEFFAMSCEKEVPAISASNPEIVPKITPIANAIYALPVVA